MTYHEAMSHLDRYIEERAAQSPNFDEIAQEYVRVLIDESMAALFFTLASIENGNTEKLFTFFDATVVRMSLDPAITTFRLQESMGLNTEEVMSKFDASFNAGMAKKREDAILQSLCDGLKGLTKKQ